MTKPLPKTCQTCKHWFREATLDGLQDHGDCLGRGPATTTAINFVCDKFKREPGALKNPKTVMAISEMQKAAGRAA